jgi:hypothetical protein
MTQRELPRASFVGGPKCGDTYEVGCSPLLIARKRDGAIVYDRYRLHPERVHGHMVFGGAFVYRYEGEEEAEHEDG